MAWQPLTENNTSSTDHLSHLASRFLSLCIVTSLLISLLIKPHIHVQIDIVDMQAGGKAFVMPQLSCLAVSSSDTQTDVHLPLLAIGSWRWSLRLLLLRISFSCSQTTLTPASQQQWHQKPPTPTVDLILLGVAYCRLECMSSARPAKA